MIDITIPSKRVAPKLPPTHSRASSYVSSDNKTLFEEAKRRDGIVRKLADACPYKQGDIVKPSYQTGIDQYGESIRIVRITDTYGKFGKNEEWPASDNPMIIHAFSEKLQQHFMCTTGFLVKA